MTSTKISRSVSLILTVVICFLFLSGGFSVQAASAEVIAGVKNFQQYINRNLPSNYLGTSLAVDGSAGVLTKAAAVKLIQYRLIQHGANIPVNGVFDMNTKNAYRNRIGKLKRYDQGPWIYILQGLLYCNGYDPKGFDGSYGAAGGTGCLNAVNSFKSNRKISEGGSGDVGAETMFALAWGVAPTNVQGGNLNFVVMSDAHISGSNASNYYVANLKNAFWDIACYNKTISAVLIAGDLTENGTEAQYQGLVEALKVSHTQNILMTMGNHDAGRNLSGGYSEAFSRFNKYCWSYSSKIQNAAHPYYDRWINGYHFIVLCTEKAEWDQAYLSPTQLAWFERKMAEGAENGKPIFVMCHQAINNTHPRTNSAAEQLGAQSDAVKKIIAKYPQTIYMSGHTHNGFGYSPLINNGEGYLVHIPPLKGSSYGYGSTSVLWYVRVHNDKVVFEARDFGTKKWLTQYNITIDLTKVRPMSTPTPVPTPTPTLTPTPTQVLTPTPSVSPSPIPVINDIFSQTEDSEYVLMEDYITGITEKTEPTAFLERFLYREELRLSVSQKYIGTGCRIDAIDETGSIYAVVPGDIDGNGILSSTDYIYMKRYFSGVIESLDRWQYLAADIDHDGRITSTDYIKLRRYFDGQPLIES